MASGLKKGPKSVSTKSLGSFVDIQSASSSDFEPVDLEDMESADEGELKSSGNSQQGISGTLCNAPCFPQNTSPVQNLAFLPKLLLPGFGHSHANLMIK